MRLWIEEGNSNQSISVSYFLGGVTNFRDRVDNWINVFKHVTPSENEAFDPIFKKENLIFRNRAIGIAPVVPNLALYKFFIFI